MWTMKEATAEAPTLDAKEKDKGKENKKEAGKASGRRRQRQRQRPSRRLLTLCHALRSRDIEVQARQQLMGLLAGAIQAVAGAGA